MKVHDGKWDTDDYNYCKEHQQYYKKYCSGYALSLPIEEIDSRFGILDL